MFQRKLMIIKKHGKMENFSLAFFVYKFFRDAIKVKAQWKFQRKIEMKHRYSFLFSIPRYYLSQILRFTKTRNVYYGLKIHLNLTMSALKYKIFPDLYKYINTSESWSLHLLHNCFLLVRVLSIKELYETKLFAYAVQASRMRPSFLCLIKPSFRRPF